MYLLGTANIIFLSFIRFELLSFEHGNPISHKMWKKFCGAFVRVKSSFLSPRGTRFPSHLLSTLCPYLESLTCFHGKDLIVRSLYVHLKDRKAGWR